jgi:hypothetical protein
MNTNKREWLGFGPADTLEAVYCPLRLISIFNRLIF